MTDKYAVIGNPIAHSKSPQIHKMFAEQTGEDISYERIEAPLDGFAAKVDELRATGYKGCNVTVPFKFEAFIYAQQNLSDGAQVAKAVNTLKFDDEIIFGANTDGAGLVRDIEYNLRVSLQGKRVLLMGAGGASWGVAIPLLQREANITIVSRTDEPGDKAFELAQFLQRSIFADSVGRHNQPTSTSYGKLASNQKFDLIINATSSGLSDEMPPLPPNIFAHGALAYDLMYGRETPFMKFALAQGVSKDRVIDGLGMLVEQAAESFFIWRGVHPETAPVITALRKQQ